MAQIFDLWVNRLPVYIIVALVVLAPVTALGAWYYLSPEYTDVGYQPAQPVPYSHPLHAGELEIDCRYCHAQVEVSAVASVPPTQICMNCHRLVARDSEKLKPIRDSYSSGQPMRWVRVHKIPEYAYFNHGLHVRAGVGCASCHGDVTQMEEITQVEPLSMGWCLDCHRNPDLHLRPLDAVTEMAWTPPSNQLELAAQMKQERGIDPPTDCTGCHR